MSYTSRAFRAFCLVALGILIGRWTIPIPTVSAQTQSPKGSRQIQIGSVPVRLDSTKDSVLAALGGKNYKVSDSGRIFPDGSEFFVVSNASDAIGSVQFKQGRLDVATREWGETEAPEALTLFQKMYGAFESATSDKKLGGVICKTVRNPNQLLMTIMADFDGRSVTLYRAENDHDAKPYIRTGVEESISR
jgi:hypothetical protein